jgi:hypothetical protein
MTVGVVPTIRQPVWIHHPARQNPVRYTSIAFQLLSTKDVYQISCGRRYTAPPHITGVSSPKMRGTGWYWGCALYKEDETVFENRGKR